MANFITDISSVVTAGIGWIGDVGTAVLANPVLTVSIGLGILGSAIGLFVLMLRRV